MRHLACDTLLGPNEVLVSPSILSSAEQATLARWTEDQHAAGKLLKTPPDAGAFSTPFCSSRGGRTRLTGSSQAAEESSDLIWVPDIEEQHDNLLPDIFWQVRDRVVERLSLSTLKEDDYKGSFISYIAPGTGVHVHRDARLAVAGEEFLILRCNVMLERPSEGGMPVIRGTLIDVPERGMWVFFPTELVHSATKVCGHRFRATLSFGFLLPPDALWDRRFRVAPDFLLERDASAQPTSILLAQLRAATGGSDVARHRIDLLTFILDAETDFTVREAARALGEPPTTVSTALCELQKSGITESASSRECAQGVVIVP